jgi:hypothetical protein
MFGGQMSVSIMSLGKITVSEISVS